MAKRSLPQPTLEHPNEKRPPFSAGLAPALAGILPQVF